MWYNPFGGFNKDFMETTRKIERVPEPPERKKKSKVWTVIKIALIAIFSFAIIGAVLVWAYIYNIVKDLEPIDPDKVSEQLYENSVIVDSQGNVLEQIQAEGLRKVVKYADISKSAIDAFIAVEDKTFETHNGFNIIRIIGATLNHYLKGDALGGVSTITQQLARNVYLFDRRSERSLERKIAEAHYTIQLEKYLTKAQIMEGYLNLIYFGMEAYGIEAAANKYFSKSAKDLDYIEAALLVGTVKAPSIYAPMLRYEKKHVPEDAYIIDDSDQLYTVVFNEDCINRYKTCLELMYENGKITEKEFRDGLKFDVRTKLHYGTLEGTEISSYFSDAVTEEVIHDLMEKKNLTRREAWELLQSGGLRIESTIDFESQKILESHYESDNFNYYYGLNLVNAINEFQEKYGLEVNGKADTPTLDKLCELTGTDRSLFTDEFYAQGENIEAVRLIKQALYKLGLYIVNEQFPKIIIRVDENGDIVNHETGRLLLRRKDNMLSDDGKFVIQEGEYEFTSTGNLILYTGKRMNFYPKYTEEGELERIQITLKDFYTLPPSYDPAEYVSGRYTVDSIFTYSGRDILIPDEFKRFDEDFNVVISRQFLREHPDFFELSDDKTLKVDPENFVVSNTPIIQPQSAMVIIDPSTGHLKALVGGRSIKGGMLFNRAMNPRQPGSAIKPISVYIAAIDSGEYSPATVIDDRPVYLAGSSTYRWPINWYETYRTGVNYYGLITIREAINVSANVPAAVIADKIGIPTVVKYLEDLGVTSVVSEGPVNDYNLAAMSLGAMSVGISPLEMAQAYGAIANEGMLNKVTTYTRVTNNRGEVILEKKVEPKFVVSPQVAYIMRDLLRTAVSEGLARQAQLANHVVSGKTGSTNDNIDAWFVGFTPYYVGATWFGNDLNIPLAQGSEFSAGFWREVMEDLHEGLEPKEVPVPSGIIRVTVDTISGKLPSELSKEDPRNTIRSDLFISGFEPTEVDDVHVKVKICKASGKLATKYCPEDEVEEKVMVKRPVPYNPKDHKDIQLRDSKYDAPTEECDVHNEKTHREQQEKDKDHTGHSGNWGFDPSNYKGIPPLKERQTGDLMVQRPYPIMMLDGSTMILMPGDIIRKEGGVTRSDGSEIPNDKIYKIEKYTTEELDAYFETGTDDSGTESDHSDESNSGSGSGEESGGN